MKNTLFRSVIRALALCLVLLAVLSAQALAAYSGTPKTPMKITSSTYAYFGLTEENWSPFNGYYGIRNAEELYGFAQLVNGGDRTAKAVLLQDIVVNETVSGSGTKHVWTPIGSGEDNSFIGVFDGNGHTISGLYYDNANASFVGLFGVVGKYLQNDYASISNVTLANSFLRGMDLVGGIAGLLDGRNDHISNCTIAPSVTLRAATKDEEAFLGGIAGGYGLSYPGQYPDHSVRNCVVLGSLIKETAGCYAGAVVGDYSSASSQMDYIEVSNCYYLEDCLKINNSPYNYGKGGVYGHASDDGCTRLASLSASHTHLPVSVAATTANCTYPGVTAHSFCLICGEVTSGTKTVIPADGTSHVYNPTNCVTAGVCQACGHNKGKDPDNHKSAEYTYKLSSSDPKKHDIFHKCCGALAASAAHTYVDYVCTDCKTRCPHNSFTGGVCDDCGTKGDLYIYYEWNAGQLTQKYGSAAAKTYNGETSLSSGWYIVKKDWNVKQRIMVNGNVHLILADGVHLNAEYGISLYPEKSLHIYAQSTSLSTAGKLTAIGDYVHNAGIGGSTLVTSGQKEYALDPSAGNLTIHGGVISATGSSASAGIGGVDPNGVGGNVVIFGGHVTAKGGDNGAGIGNGGGYYDLRAGWLTVRGGTVRAEGTKSGTGIGSASTHGRGADVRITGGSVLAIAGFDPEAGYTLQPIGGGKDRLTSGTLKNADNGDNLSLYTLVLDTAADSAQVNAISGTAAASYGVSDVYAQGGKLYFYLPKETDIASAVSTVTADGKTYYYNETNESGEHLYTLHVHSWGYAAGDSDGDGTNDTITATCSSSKGECPSGRCSVTLSAPADLTYDGSSRDAVLTYDSWAFGEENKPEITYNGVSRTDVTGSPVTASISLGGETVTLSYTLAKAPIASVTLDVTAPVAGAAPQASITGLTGCSGAIVWTPSPETFDYNTAYAASVTLVPDGNHFFPAAPDAAGWTGALSADGSAVYTRSFTTALRKIVSVTPPALAAFGAYHADAASAIAALPQTITVALEAGGSGSLPLTWAAEGAYDPTPSASNTFHWTAANTAYDENDCVLTGTCVIANAAPIPVVNGANDASRTYDGQPFDVSALFTFGEHAGTPAYALVAGDTAYASLQENKLTIMKAGEFSIQMTTAAHGAYGEGAPVVARLTVGKGTPVTQSDVPTGFTAWYSQTLADVNLNATAHPLGTWSWADDTLSVGNAGASGNAFPVVFMPHDDGLWNTVTGLTASISVSSADTGLAVSPQDAAHIYGDTFSVTVAVTAQQPDLRIRGLLGSRSIPAPGSVSIEHGGNRWQQSATNGDTLTFPFDTVAEGFLPGGYTLPVTYTTDGNMNAQTAELRFSVAYLTEDENGNPIPDAVPGAPSSGEWYREAPALTAPNGYQVSTGNGPDASWGDNTALTPVEGENEYTYYLKNEDGQIAEKKIPLKVDLTAPAVSETTVTATDATAEITVSAEDAHAGVASIVLTAPDSSVSITDNGGGSFSLSGLTPGKEHTFTLTVKDNAGNQTTLPVTVLASPAVRITAPLAPTSVSAVSGQSVVLSVTAENASAFKWYRSTDDGATFAPIKDANAPDLNPGALELSHSGHQFFCRVYGHSGVLFADSPVFTLTVKEPVLLPETGDQSVLLLWMLLLAVSLCALPLLPRRTKDA
ncbi:MAG: hypothetical protein IKJ11_03630 [Clostridia bacterium]|nr:hypothetical protein [Clostridia bacterium]